MNFLKETTHMLEKCGKTWDDVRWIGTKEQCIPIESFKRYADIGYHEGFGTQIINSELLVVGDNFWLERHEYDGSEWWEYKEMPIKPESVNDHASLLFAYYEEDVVLNRSNSVGKQYDEDAMRKVIGVESKWHTCEEYDEDII